MQQPQQHHDHQADTAYDQQPFPMPSGKQGGASAFLSGSFCRPCGGLRRFLCALHSLAGLARRPICCRILPLKSFFVPDAGNGIGTGKLRVFSHRLLIAEGAVGFDGLPFCLGSLPPGFQLVICLPVLNTTVAIAHGLLQTALSQMARLNAGIFLLHLPDFSVGGGAKLLHGA